MGHLEGMEGEVGRRKGMVKYTPPATHPLPPSHRMKFTYPILDMSYKS